MVKTNKTYDAPDMNVYQVHTEGVMCESYGSVGAAGAKGNYVDLTTNPENDY